MNAELVPSRLLCEDSSFWGTREGRQRASPAKRPINVFEITTLRGKEGSQGTRPRVLALSRNPYLFDAGHRPPFSDYAKRSRATPTSAKDAFKSGSAGLRNSGHQTPARVMKPALPPSSGRNSPSPRSIANFGASRQKRRCVEGDQPAACSSSAPVKRLSVGRRKQMRKCPRSSLG